MQEPETIHRCYVCDGDIDEGDNWYEYDDDAICDNYSCREQVALERQDGLALKFVCQEDYIGGFAEFLALGECFLKAQHLKLEDLLVGYDGKYKPVEYIKHIGAEMEFVDYYEKENAISKQIAEI